MKNILIFEPNTNGHYIQYVRLLIKEALEREASVTLLTYAHNSSLKNFRDSINDFTGKISIEYLIDKSAGKYLLKGSSQRKRQFAYYRDIRKYFKTLSTEDQPDIVFVPFLNNLFIPTVLFGSPFDKVPFSGILLHLSFHLDKVGVRSSVKYGSIARKFFYRFLNFDKLKFIVTVDPTFIRYLRKEKSPSKSKVRYIGDPAIINGRGSKEMIRRSIGLMKEDIVILVYGVISLRKGIIPLLKVIEGFNFPANVKVVLAGRQHRDCRTFLQTNIPKKLRMEGRLIEINEYLDEQTEYEVFKASDFVWVGYQNFYSSSGVLVQAAKCGLPVIACKEGLIGWMTKKYDLGIRVTPSYHNSIANAIVTLIENPDLINQFERNGKKMAVNHDSELFARSVLNEIFNADFIDKERINSVEESKKEFVNSVAGISNNIKLNAGFIFGISQYIFDIL